MCQEVSPTQCDASEHSQNKSSYLISIKCLISTIFKETGQKEIHVAVFFLCPPTLFFSIRRPGNLWHWLSSGVLPVSISDLEVWLRGSERNREREGEENSDNTKTGCSLCNPIASPKTSWPQPPPPPSPHLSVSFLLSFSSVFMIRNSVSQSIERLCKTKTFTWKGKFCHYGLTIFSVDEKWRNLNMNAVIFHLISVDSDCMC